MKKILLAASVIGAVGAVVLLGTTGVAPAEFRTAIVSVSCLQEHGITIDQVNRVCLDHWRTGDYLECDTDRTQIHPCEIADQDLPDAAFRRFVICRTDENEIRRMFVKLSDTTPPGWTCKVICPKIKRTRSKRGFKSDLVDCLIEACDPCPVAPGSWGDHCPMCAARGDCSEVCAVDPDPEDPPVETRPDPGDPTTEPPPD